MQQIDAKDLDLHRAIAWCAGHLPASTESILRGAAAEGRLELAVQMLGDRGIHDALIAAFQTRFPFVDVGLTMGYAVELQPMLIEEVRSGRGVHDHFQISSNLNEAAALRDSGALLPFPISQDAAFPAAAKSSGHWYARTRTPVVTIYRKGALTEAEIALLHSYQGLTDPCFRDRLGMLDISATMAAVTVSLLPDAVWQGIADNRPRVRATGGPLLDGLIAGDYDLAVFGPLGTAVQAVRSGAPVAFLCPAPSAMLYGALGVISSAAPHPNAAKLWSDWSNSTEATALFAHLTGHISPRPDTGPSWVEQQSWYHEDPDQAVTVDWPGFAARQPGIISRFRRDIG